MLILCLILPLTLLSSLTVLIETRIISSLEDLNPDEAIRVVSVETGLMDALFENGHIFFNLYNTPNEDGDYLANGPELAAENRADTMVELIPDPYGVYWKVVSIGNNFFNFENYERLSQIDQVLNERERWIALGTIVGRRIVEIITHGQ